MTDRKGDGQKTQKIKIWDLPTRVFHWVLALLFVVCFVSGTQERFDIHIPAGQALLVLVAARILWGFLGSETSRLRSLFYSPREILAYIRNLLRRTSDRRVGHNPLGSLSVIAMLLLLVVQAGLGLFAADTDGLNEGPLSFLVEYSAARQASELHELVADVLLILVGLHLAAVLFYLLYKRDNLVGPMVTGRAERPAAAATPQFVSSGRAVLVLAASAVLVLGGIELAQSVF